MGTFFILVLLGLAAFLVTMLYKYINGNKMIATDDLYQQRGVTVDYKAATIQINQFQYKIGQVTGISLVTISNGRRNDYAAKIEVDDMQKPVHKIKVIGSKQNADEFVQRICVAIRKAGGPNFY